MGRRIKRRGIGRGMGMGKNSELNYILYKINKLVIKIFSFFIFNYSFYGIFADF